MLRDDSLTVGGSVSFLRVASFSGSVARECST